MADLASLNEALEQAKPFTLTRVECGTDFMDWLTEHTVEDDDDGFFATARYGIPVICDGSIPEGEARLIGPDGVEQRRLIIRGDQVYSIDPSVFELPIRPNVRMPFYTTWGDDE